VPVSCGLLCVIECCGKPRLCLSPLILQAPQPQELRVPEAEGQLAPDASIVFVLGGPGSGKGTQCAKIVEKYGYTHL